MLDAEITQLALRARLDATTVATTGSTSLSATTTGYARAAGSFLTDGFRVGMEITSVTGFSTGGNNQATTSQGRMITAVTATAISCSGCTTESAGSGRTITVGIPYQKASEDVAFTPVGGFPYTEEVLVPTGTRVHTFPVSTGHMTDDGLYVVTVYGLSGKGSLRAYADAILARFAPGTTFTLSDGNTLRIPSQLGPKAGAITRIDGGWSFVVCEIPYVGESINAVA